MTDTFFGVPIRGDISQGGSRVEQKPASELAPLVQAMLDDPTIVEFGWRQYTPYFNDGAVCEFSAYGLWVRTETDTDPEDEDELGLDYGVHPSLGGFPYKTNPETGRYERQSYEGSDKARYDRAQTLTAAIEGGAFENVLLDKFGDHASITVRRDGVEVEFYEHD